MKRTRSISFELRTVDELSIDDEDSFRHVALYADLKEVLRRAAYPFRILPKAHAWRADRALLLNLAFWDAGTRGGDVLVDGRIEADVVAHAAWHYLAARAFAPGVGDSLSADALFMGEAIASAFDVYLVGRLLGHAPGSTFLETQVPAMRDTAAATGLSAKRFRALLADMARRPDRAFADLRELLSEATAGLYASRGAEEACATLAALDGHRYSALLHRYELANWVLYARAMGGRAKRDAAVVAVERALRRSKSPLEWLATQWIVPALAQEVHAARRGRHAKPMTKSRERLPIAARNRGRLRVGA